MHYCRTIAKIGFLKRSLARQLFPALALVAVISAAVHTTPAWALKFCDLTSRHCVEQKCELPFNRVRKGILNAYAFFEHLGYYGKFDVDIVFEHEVLTILPSNKDVSKIRLLGKYEENQKTIYMTCWGEKWLSKRNDFELEMTADFYETIITHEMIHFLANRYAKTKLDVILSEYIAYSGQLSLFPEAQIKFLASKYNASAFENDEISELTFVMSPGLFALKSYLHFKKTNGVLVKKILEGSFTTPSRPWPPY